MTVVGVVGAGRMGLPVCARLVGAGFGVIAADRDGSRRDVVERAGARWAPDVEAVCREAPLLVTVLPGARELEEVMGGALPLLAPGSGWIDLGSTGPVVGARLRARAGRVWCVDAPMGGGPDRAREGMLQLFVGGTRSAVERASVVLDALGTVVCVGGPGAGQVVKHLVNLLWFGQAVAVGEALLLARKAGLELEAVRAALAGSAADSRFIREDLDALLAGDYLTDFGLDRCCEELDAVVEVAREHEVPFELSTLVRDLHRRALDRYGPRDGELLAVALLEELAGLDLRSGGS